MKRFNYAICTLKAELFWDTCIANKYNSSSFPIVTNKK